MGSGSPRTNGGVEIPVSVCGGGVFVPIRVDQSPPLSFLLDSGFETSAIDSNAAARLGLRLEAARTELAPGGSVRTARAAAVDLSVSGLSWSIPAIETLELSDFAPFFGHAVDGILGYDFFERFVLELDYESSRLTALDPASIPETFGKSLPTDLASRQPYVPAQIELADGRTAEAMLEVDTGKIDPISLNADFARKAGLFREGDPSLPLTGVSLGGQTRAWLIRGRAVRLGGFALAGPVIGVAEENADRAGQIGYGILRRFAIVFDYPRKEIRLRPNSGLSKPFEFDHAGVILRSTDAVFSRLEVFAVVPAGPADEAGIRTGDELLAIDGRPAKGFGLDGAREYFEGTIGRIGVTVRRGDQVRDVSVDLRPLV